MGIDSSKGRLVPARESGHDAEVAVEKEGKEERNRVGGEGRRTLQRHERTTPCNYEGNKSRKHDEQEEHGSENRECWPMMPPDVEVVNVPTRSVGVVVAVVTSKQKTKCDAVDETSVSERWQYVCNDSAKAHCIRSRETRRIA